MTHPLLHQLPEPIRSLGTLTLDLRWTWCHGADSLWTMLDAELWERTRNPWLVLQNTPKSRLDSLAADPHFLAELARVQRECDEYVSRRRQWEDIGPPGFRGPIAYFSMEFGVAEGLPIYSGGLGVLSGDHLKTASDLGVPIVGIGLLYQEGYFRQMLDRHGRQIELYPANLPHTLPISAVRGADGQRLIVPVDLPGRTLRLLVWQAQVGRVPLYLLDSNDPLNSPADRGITGQLYGGGKENRLTQEIALGIGGWRLLQALDLEPAVCHLNEGHAALVTLERARTFMKRHQVGFWPALWATRAGNVFTTHTPVAAAFDTFPVELLAQYGRDYAAELRLPPEHLLALGRLRGDPDEPFNMAYLAARTCGRINAVSRLHGEVSRRIFQDLYPRWPRAEVPIGHVTNGVHMPSWDSAHADRLWTAACGKTRWLGRTNALGQGIAAVPDEQLWDMRAASRLDLVDYARRRLATQLAQRGASAKLLARSAEALDPNVLTLGFARRFTEYKRPSILLRDAERLARLLGDPSRPVQIIVAGKAHAHDEVGKGYIAQWSAFANRDDVRTRAVFLEDYDMTLAAHLVQGVDVWINTPRRAWEACGTSGMKVLVNGGLNLSELDGWWAEAYTPEVGWGVNGSGEIGGPADDEREAEMLYRLLEEQVVPEFYRRDASGLPRQWIARLRASMTQLTPQFSTNRMLLEYVRDYYLPAAADYAQRCADGAAVAQSLWQWERQIRRRWHEVHAGALEVTRDGEGWAFSLPVYLGDLPADSVAAQLYAEPAPGEMQAAFPMQPVGPVPGAINGVLFRAHIATGRPAADFTLRLVPSHPHAKVPLETNRIRWIEH
ncbi:MAG: alpha-glucan family phosphorylase [Burkholderiales bacterium]|nr:MAG: alpha-glucan family phosphorylase [Burkholderiales bacterium]